MGISWYIRVYMGILGYIRVYLGNVKCDRWLALQMEIRTEKNLTRVIEHGLDTWLDTWVRRGI